MFKLPLHIVPSSFVVFEGLDNTGKSTQMDRFERAVYAPEGGEPLYDGKPVFTHSPSGGSDLGTKIYGLTEDIDWRKHLPLTRQFLHLAAHCEMYENVIVPKLSKGGAVFLDRNWWSAYAYGWVKGMRESTASDEFIDLVKMPTQGVSPSVYFLFLEVLKKDKSNNAQVLENYEHLAELHADATVLVPRLARGETTAFISEHLTRRQITIQKHDEEDS